MSAVKKIAAFVKNHNGTTVTMEYNKLDNLGVYTIKVRNYELNKTCACKFTDGYFSDHFDENEEAAIDYILDYAEKEIFKVTNK